MSKKAKYLELKRRVTRLSKRPRACDDVRKTIYGGIDYDAAGQAYMYHRLFAASGEREVTRYYNGDGREEKRSARNYVETSPDVWAWQTEPSEYYIRSTVLGGEVVSNVNWQGEKTRTYVRGGGMEIAWQNGTSQNGSVVFQHRDPAGASFRSTGYFSSFTRSRVIARR
jgi:hypothetical protein